MKLLVLGATGRTGRELLAGALRQGHEVTALARDPSRLTVHDDRLRVCAGSATDPDTVDKAVAGQDAVLCALGRRQRGNLCIASSCARACRHCWARWSATACGASYCSRRSASARAPATPPGFHVSRLA